MPDSTGVMLNLQNEEIGLLRACFRHGHTNLTPEARSELRMIEAKVNAAVGGPPDWTEPFGSLPVGFAAAVARTGGGDDYRL